MQMFHSVIQNKRKHTNTPLFELNSAVIYFINHVTRKCARKKSTHRASPLKNSVCDSSLMVMKCIRAKVKRNEIRDKIAKKK